MLALARDIAAVILALSMALTAVVLFSGVAGLSGGVAASVATMAAAGLASFALYGLAEAVVSPPIGAMAVVTAALVLTGAFLGAHYFGVRGLWIAFLAAVGASVAWLLIFAFAHRLGSGGAWAPMLTFVLLALLSFAAVGAAARAAGERAAPVAEAGGAESEGEALAVSGPQIAAARRMFGEPPFWFDCAYATLGGSAARPAMCPFNPPRVATTPSWTTPPTPLDNQDDALDVVARAPDDGAEPAGRASRPGIMASPGEPDPGTPSFEGLRAQEGSAPPTPGAMADAGVVDALDSAMAADPDEPDAEAEAPPESPAPPGAPDRLATVAPEDAAPGAVAAPDSPAVAALGAASAPESAEVGPALPRVGEPERRRAEFICFPMLGALAERLCPDQRLTEADFELSWREEGGVASAVPDQVECFFDAGQALHATLVVNLSGDLIGPIARNAKADGGRLRKSDAIYEMATRLIGSARSGLNVSDGRGPSRLFLSMYVANGSKLLSPWASQDFGSDRYDRLIDVRSSGQTLALLRRLKTETQSLRRGVLAGDLTATLNAAAEERPPAPFEAGQNLMILVTDQAATAMMDVEEAEALGARLGEAGIPIFSVTLDVDESPEALTRLAEASGAAAYGARDALALAEAVERAMLRARSFCALQVRAPESFFERGALEVKLRRRLDDGCVLEQVATRSCEGLTISQRIDASTQ